MLVSFTLRNHACFRDRAELRLEATGSARHDDRFTFDSGSRRHPRLSRAAAIYGAERERKVPTHTGALFRPPFRDRKRERRADRRRNPAPALPPRSGVAWATNDLRDILHTGRNRIRVRFQRGLPPGMRRVALCVATGGAEAEAPETAKSGRRGQRKLVLRRIRTRAEANLVRHDTAQRPSCLYGLAIQQCGLPSGRGLVPEPPGARRRRSLGDLHCPQGTGECGIPAADSPVPPRRPGRRSRFVVRGAADSARSNAANFATGTPQPDRRDG